MPNSDRDPVVAVKEFLRTGKSEPSPMLAKSIRAIQARLARARKRDPRIDLSDALLEHLFGEGGWRQAATGAGHSGTCDI